MVYACMLCAPVDGYMQWPKDDIEYLESLRARSWQILCLLLGWPLEYCDLLREGTSFPYSRREEESDSTHTGPLYSNILAMPWKWSFIRLYLTIPLH